MTVARRAASALLLMLLALPAAAEPYLAVREGQPCSVCHVNPSGAGLRTPYGDLYSQTALVESPVDSGARGPWTGALNEFLRVGGNFRYDGRYAKLRDQKSSNEFATDELRVYGSAELIPNRLGFYVDQRLAPGQSQNREAWGLLWSPGHRYYLKAGRMYLPFGLRLQDDETYVREASGVNFATPDEGVEIGLDAAPWSAQLALSNGAGGATENDRGKQATASFAFVRQRWRAGASLGFNDSALGERRMAAVFAGLATGPVAWLFEADTIDDSGFAGGRRKFHAGLLEANWNFRRGHNLKLGLEHLDPDTDVDEDQQDRYSAVWEWVPIQFLQLRLGYRHYDGIPQSALQNRREGFAQLHVYF